MCSSCTLVVVVVEAVVYKGNGSGNRQGQRQQAEGKAIGSGMAMTTGPIDKETTLFANPSQFWLKLSWCALGKPLADGRKARRARARGSTVAHRLLGEARRRRSASGRRLNHKHVAEEVFQLRGEEARGPGCCKPRQAAIQRLHGQASQSRRPRDFEQPGDNGTRASQPGELDATTCRRPRACMVCHRR